MNRMRVVLPLSGWRFLLSASMVVFALEFFVFSWIAVSVNQDVEHIMAVLQWNSLSVTNSYVQGFVSRTVWYGILPTVLGMGLFLASFASRSKALAWWGWNVILLIGGAFVLFLGASLFQYTQQFVRVTVGDYVARSMQTIFSAQQWLSVFWILAGALFIVSAIPSLAHAIARELRENSLSWKLESDLSTND